MSAPLPSASAPQSAAIPVALLDELFVTSGAAQWDVSRGVFDDVLNAAMARRFSGAAPAPEASEAFLRALHLHDLALACACRQGHEAAWEHFMREYRPALHAAGRAIAGTDRSHDLVDSLFADLFGLSESDGVRRSLFAYYHGRARLTTWLRSVLAQRHVDAFRSSARTVPLDEASVATSSAGVVEIPGDPHRGAYLRMAQRALDGAIASLAADERLRLRLYYGQSLKLAQIGRLLGEHEATVSRKIERARHGLRLEVERRLCDDHGLTPDAIRACLDEAGAAPEMHLSQLLSGNAE